ncbi:PKD domain-containing protein, partial [Crocinitomix sp.]|nr:PKD domain-containing protein [Crocinitomix sp.]
SPPGDLEIGASTSATAFGTSIFTATPTVMAWGNHTFTFIAPNDATHITVRNTTGFTRWNHVDHFEFIVVEDELEVDYTNLTCFGVCDGTATVIGGIDGPYTYLWDVGAGGGTDATATDLCAGTYTVEVTSASGELTELEVIIDEPDEVIGTITSQTNVSCFGGADGIVDIGVTGGIGDYTYDIGAGPVVDSEFTGLAAGTYIITVMDELGCTELVELEITSPDELVLIAVFSDDLTCFESGDGSIEVVASGGTGAYSFSIDGGVYGPGTTFGGLAAGIHTVAVRDENDCENSIDIELIEPVEITVAETVEGEFCLGDCTGSIELEVLTGEGPFTYSIDACATISIDPNFSDLCAGDYEICIVNEGGCEYSGTVSVSEGTTEVDPTLNPIAPLCLTADAVTITGVDLGILTGPGVVGGVFNPSIAGAGTHTITNTVEFGCGGIGTLDVTVYPLPNVSFISPDETAGCEPVRVEFNATGTPGISCLWNFGDGAYSTSCGTAIHTYETAGEYDVSLTVTDANGCTNSTTYFDYINVYDIPEADFGYTPNSVTTINPEVSFINLSTGETSWNWNFADLAGSNEENPAFIFPEVEGDYPVTLIVESEFGCADTITKIIRVNQEQLIFVPNIITPDGDAFNEVFKPYFTGVDIYNYHLTIHNRYGEIIFESYDLSKGWNGAYGGEIVQDGVYIWHIITSEITTDKKLEYHGHVTVLR